MLPFELEKPIEINKFRMFVPDSGYKWLDALPRSTDALVLGSPPYMVIDEPQVLGPDIGMVLRAVSRRPDERVLEYDPMKISAFQRRAREYEPLTQIPDLFKRFMRLNPERDALLDFANQYGWIGSRGLVRSEGSHFFRPAVGIAAWKYEIQSMIVADRLIAWAKANDRHALREYFSSHPDKQNLDVCVRIQIEGLELRPAQTAQLCDPGVLTWHGWLGNSLHRGYTDQLSRMGWRHGEFAVPAMELAAQIVNARITEFCHPVLQINTRAGINGYWTAKNLLGCIWLQFYLTLIGQLRLRRCEVCGLEMDVSKNRSNRRMHPRCSRSSRQARWRAKTKPGKTDSID